MQNNAVVYLNPTKLFVYNKMTFGEWLRKTMNAKGITNAEMARRVNVSGTYIGNLLRDYSPNKISLKPTRPSETVVDAIAKALNVPRNEARLAAGYAPVGEETEAGLFSGLERLSPEMQVIAKKQIRAIIDSLVVPDEHETQND